MGEGFEGLVEEAHPSPNPSPPRRGGLSNIVSGAQLSSFPDLPTATQVLGL